MAELRIHPEPYRTRESVLFDATDSHDPSPDGTIERYRLQITGPTHNTGENVQQTDRTVEMQGGKYTHRFTAAGTYDVRLRIDDDDGNTATEIKKIEIHPGTEAPNAKVEVRPADPVAGEQVRFDGSPSKHSEPIVGYDWTVYRVGEKNPLFEIKGQQFTYKFAAGKYTIDSD